MTANATGYYTHPDCRRHDMGEGHPECPQRLDAIEDRLLITGVGDALERREAPPAALSELALAHDRMHLAALQGLEDQLAEQIEAGGPAHIHIDADTSMNRHTWEAARRAAGAAIAATSAVTRARCFIAAPRPPAVPASQTHPPTSVPRRPSPAAPSVRRSDLPGSVPG